MDIDKIKYIIDFSKKTGIHYALEQEDIEILEYILEEREEDKKRIEELEAKLEFKKWGDLDNLEFEEYMKEFIPKQKVKDNIDKYIEQRLVELNETGSYILDEGTPKQERLNGMQKGANDIKKILLEDK